MVVCLRLEIDDAFESDLETLKYIVYEGTLHLMISKILYCTIFNLAPCHQSNQILPLNTNTKDSSAVKTASTGQREPRELFVETYIFDGE